MNYTDPIRIHLLNNSYHFEPEVSVSEICFAIVLSGSNSLRINESTYDSGGSFLFLTPSSMELSIRGTGKAALLICKNSLIDDLLKTTFGNRIRIVLSGIQNGDLFKCYPLKSSDIQIVEQLLMRISIELNFRKREYDQVIQLLLLELLFLLKHNRPKDNDELREWSSIQRVWSINDVIRYVEKNFDGTYSLDELASRCALNSSYFSRAFKVQAGVPLFEYINRLRINRACQLLKSSDMNILDIAFSVGYNNVSFFNRYFKKLKMISPGEFRHKIRG